MHFHSSSLNSVVDNMDVDMTDFISIWDYCIHGLEHHIPDDNGSDLQILVNAVIEIASVFNCLISLSIIVLFVTKKDILLIHALC